MWAMSEEVVGTSPGHGGATGGYRTSSVYTKSGFAQRHTRVF